eukprot:TRINITY_DN2293_c0_g1_i3.p1 TRINITY_DN2293_c0_g1~~TRINITY_DN2293_c0_g1_i3.p1  ORF type:complete len:152 (-),score=27.35 TRINITY_DN2293_c0_g1_i3:567-1022(-)
MDRQSFAEALRHVLERAGLAQFADVFLAQGFEDMDAVRAVTEDGLVALGMTAEQCHCMLQALLQPDDGSAEHEGAPVQQQQPNGGEAYHAVLPALMQMACGLISEPYKLLAESVASQSASTIKAKVARIRAGHYNKHAHSRSPPRIATTTL